MYMGANRMIYRHWNVLAETTETIKGVELIDFSCLEWASRVGLTYCTAHRALGIDQAFSKGKFETQGLPDYGTLRVSMYDYKQENSHIY